MGKAAVFGIVGLLVLVVLISGCPQQAQFVCPDGSIVSDSSYCKIADNSENESSYAEQQYSPATKQQCPYACCTSGEYQTKNCQQNFKCEENSCVPLCQEVTYFENVPKEVTVPYTETVCVAVPYQEAYQEEECHNEEYSFQEFELQEQSGWDITQGCYLIVSLGLWNQENVSGEFKVIFTFNSQNYGITTGETTQSIAANDTATLSYTYDSSCFDNVSATAVTIPPQKEVCENVTKYQDKTRQECHDETKYRTETIYEQVERTKIVCEGEESGICEDLDCDDQEECTVDSCDESGCQNNSKPNSTPCADGSCQNGKCVKDATYTCDNQNCESKSTTECVGTTKVMTTYYCENNICKSTTSQEPESSYCGYAPSTEISVLDKLKSIFNDFPEFNQLANGASIDMFVWGDDAYIIIKQSFGIDVLKSNAVGDLSLVIPSEAIDELEASNNKCNSLYLLIENEVISNVYLNVDTTQLLLKNFCALKTCIPSNKVPEIGSCW